MNKTLVDSRIVELERVNESLQLGIEWLSEVNRVYQTMVGEVSLGTVYEQLSTTIHQAVGATLVFILHWENRSEKSEVSYCSVQGEFVPDTKIIQASFQKDSPLRQNIELGKIITYSKDQVASLSGPLGECFQEHEIQLLILSPLMVRQTAIGVLGVAMSKPSQDFIMQRIALIERMALDLANLTQNAVVLDLALSLAAAKERERLARDLHDSVTQTLFSATLLAEVLPQIWHNNPEQGIQKLDNLRQLTRGALAEMRTFLLELRPSSLINTPLSDLLSQLAEAVTSRSGLSFQLFIEKAIILPEEVQINFYRIAQEALNNVVKHAQAKQVTLSLSTKPLTPGSTDIWRYEVTLVIWDDGIGYSILKDRQSTHLGIGIMKERAEAIHAGLSMESRPGAGTQISLTWHSVNQEA